MSRVSWRLVRAVTSRRFERVALRVVVFALAAYAAAALAHHYFDG